MATAAPPRPAPLPPGPGRQLPGQMLLRLRRHGLLGSMTDLAREYGDIVTFKVPGERFLLLNHPDQIRDVLVTHNKLFKKGRGCQY